MTSSDTSPTDVDIEADAGGGASAMQARIESEFGSLEAFIRHDDVDVEWESIIQAELANGTLSLNERSRPDTLYGVTQCITTGYGKLYVNINEDPNTGEPFEVFCNIGDSGSFAGAFTEALAKTCSTALRAGVDINELIDALEGIRSPKINHDNGNTIYSIPHGISVALKRYQDGTIPRYPPQQQRLDDIGKQAAASDSKTTATVSGDDTSDAADKAAATATSDGSTSPAGHTNTTSTEPCPTCGSVHIEYSEGCKTCSDCGWSEC